MTNKLIMKYIGFSEYDYPAYEDQNGKIWLDTNYGNANGIINLYSSSNGLEGEPCSLISSDIEVEYETKYQRVPREFDYMMLSRYKSDCDYFLGYGNGYEGHLYYHSVNKQIEEMKELYNNFSNEEKPEWLTMEQIEDYEKQMIKKLKERNEREVK